MSIDGDLASPPNHPGETESRGVRGLTTRAVAQALVLIGIATLPWSAVQFRGIPVGDLFLLPGGFLLALSSTRTKVHLPPLLLAGSALVGLAGVATAFFPPSSSYLFSRFRLSTALQQSLGFGARSTGNLSTLSKYELALLVLPLILVLAGASSKSFVQRAAVAWVVGILLSIVAGYTDYLNLTHFSVGLIGYDPSSNRQPGLSAQANNIGVQAAMAAPLLLVAFLRPSARVRLLAGVAVAVSSLGIYVSGSRGSAVGIIGGVILTLLIVPQTRVWTVRLVFGLAIGGIYLFLTTGGSKILDVLRLTSNKSASASDAGRSMLRAQGIKDFYYSPLHGVGWGFSNEAHMIFIQLLAAGGLIGFIGVGVAIGGVLARGWRIRTDPLAGALLAATLTWLLIGFVENQLTDQWIYVPFGLLAALIGRERAARLAAQPISSAVDQDGWPAHRTFDATFGVARDSRLLREPPQRVWKGS